MEFPKFIAQGNGPSGKKVWQIKAEIDEDKGEVTMITKYGDYGGPLKTIKKVLTSKDFSKGVTTLKGLAEKEAHHTIQRKKRQGYTEMKSTDSDGNESDDKEDKNYNEKEGVEIEENEKDLMGRADMDDDEYIPNNALVVITDAEDEYLYGEVETVTP